MRFFFAAWPPRETARALQGWASALEGRVTPAENMHLTLAFLGAVDAGKAILAARRVHARPHQVPVEVAQYWKHNRVLWAGPRETPQELKALVDALHLELYRAEYILERRPRAPGTLPPLPVVDWPVREFSLVRSSLSPKGSRYEIVQRFPLA
jgi:2'-5' RNA ligase